MSKIEKLPSGSWRVRVTYQTPQGRKVKSITAPTKAEARQREAEFRAVKSKAPSYDTLREVVDKYIDLSEMLSPTTISAYKKIRDFAFQGIMDMKVSDLTDFVMQQAINQECRRTVERTGKQISPKTVKNEYGLLSSALKTVCNLSFNVRLPKVQHKNEDLPDPKIVFDAIKGTPVELPCLLAMCCSLRLSEVRGLMCSSIKGDYVYVDSVVVDVNGAEIRKAYAKTDKSIRRVYLPQNVKKIALSSDSYVRYKNTGKDSPLVPMSRNQIHHYFMRRMKDEGIDLSFHDLRHMYASIALNILHIPERFVMDAGGWSTPNVMKKVYSQSFDKERKKSDEKLNDFFRALND